MLRLPDPEDLADVDVDRGASRNSEVAAPAAPAVVTDLSERRARNPLFREAPPAGRTAPDDDDRRSARRARRVVSGPGTGTGQRARDDVPREEVPRDDVPREDAPVCATCPFGVAMLALDEVQPDARDHLLAASRELLAAARTVIESLEHTIERQQRHPTSSGPRDVQRVRVRRA